MAAEKIRIGVIGAGANYGWARDAHMPALLALPEFELSAVCTAHSDTAAESRKQYGARLAFDNYQEMVKHSDIDLVSVSVKAPLHHSMVMAALEAGKHVYCEWPLGTNIAEAEEMAALADRTGVHHMVGLQAQCDPSLMRLRELVGEGYVGEVLSCRMTMSMAGILRERDSNSAWMAGREKGAHTLSISTGHAIDVLCFCLGEFTELSGLVSTQVKEWETTKQGTVRVTGPDDVSVHGVLASGAVASVHVVTIPWHASGWKMEVYGREGTLVAFSDRMVQYVPTKLMGGRGEAASLEELDVPDRLTWIPGTVPSGFPFSVAQMFRRLGNAINGGRSAEPDFQHGVKRHRLLESIQSSSDQGSKTIKVS